MGDEAVLDLQSKLAESEENWKGEDEDGTVMRIVRESTRTQIECFQKERSEALARFPSGTNFGTMTRSEEDGAIVTWIISNAMGDMRTVGTLKKNDFGTPIIEWGNEMDNDIWIRKTNVNEL